MPQALSTVLTGELSALVGSCHGTFLAEPARQGFSEAARDCASQPEPPRPADGAPGGRGRRPRGRRGWTGGSRRGAAPGLRPGKCGGGGRQEEQEEEEGGVGGQRISRVQLAACPNACAVPAAHARSLWSALRCGSRAVLLPVRPACARVLP